MGFRDSNTFIVSQIVTGRISTWILICLTPEPAFFINSTLPPRSSDPKRILQVAFCLQPFGMKGIYEILSHNFFLFTEILKVSYFVFFFPLFLYHLEAFHSSLLCCQAHFSCFFDSRIGKFVPFFESLSFQCEVSIFVSIFLSSILRAASFFLQNMC